MMATKSAEAAKKNSKQRSLLRLAEIKEQLAAKYTRLAKTVGSKTRRQSYWNRVKKLTLQAKTARALAEQ